MNRAITHTAFAQQKKAPSPSLSKESGIETIQERKADELVVQTPAPKKVSFGMRNLGNTCFFNSVMQCLTHSRGLINFCLGGSHTSQCKKSQNCFLCLYCSYLKSLQQTQRTSPQMVVQRLRSIWSRYSIGRQEDAHEFMIIFLENLVNSCFQMAKPPREFIYKNQNKTAVFQVIGGKSRSQVKCLGCGHCSNTYEDMIALSLEFPKSRNGPTTLEQCLSHFCTAETLKGENKYLCGGCKKKCEAKKRFSIEQTPRTLIIHIKRFTNMGNKIGELVKYPPQLSLKPFMSSSIDGGTQGGSQELFDLYGVVVHQGGGCRSGHYYSFCKGFDGEWYDCNDDYVGKSSLDRVLKQQAYILFYQKRISKQAETIKEPIKPEIKPPTQLKEEKISNVKQPSQLEQQDQSTSAESPQSSSDFKQDPVQKKRDIKLQEKEEKPTPPPVLPTQVDIVEEKMEKVALPKIRFVPMRRLLHPVVWARRAEEKRQEAVVSILLLGSKRIKTDQ